MSGSKFEDGENEPNHPLDHYTQAQMLTSSMLEQARAIIVASKKDSEAAGRSDAQKLLLDNLVFLRAANRGLWQESRNSKGRTADAKGELDRLNLELQGLFYEQRHLKNEIEICKETPTVYNTVPLIDEAAFLQDRPDARGMSYRDLMEARLLHERDERVRLEDVRKGLLTRKSELIAENKKRKSDLESLEQQLTSFINSAENISAIFKKY